MGYIDVSIGKIILTNDLYKFKLCTGKQKTNDRGQVPQKHKHIAPVQLFQNTSDSQFIMAENGAWKEFKNRNAKYRKSI